MTQEEIMDKINEGRLLCEDCTENEHCEERHDGCVANGIMEGKVYHLKEYEL